MPIYEYFCHRCETEFELLVGVNSENIYCPECGGVDFRRKFSVFGMKSSGRFESSVKSSCTGCSGGDCGGCGC